MQQLSAFILSYNSAEEIPSLMDSLKGVQDVVVLDDGSTDNTVELFRSRGARVIEDKDYGKDLSTEQDVQAFRERYGFEPDFTAGELFSNASARRNYAASQCKSDWVVNPDHDERPEWDLKKLRSQMNGQGGIRHRYIFKHNPDGTPLVEFVQCKLYNRKKGEFVGRIHEVMVSKDTRMPVDATFTEDFVLHHWQKEGPHRATHLKQMQFQVVKDETVRNLHYLGREYADRQKHKEALAVYDRYFQIDSGDFPEQRSQAALMVAECHWRLGDGEKATEYCHRGIALDPSRRDGFFQMGQYHMSMGQYQRALSYFAAADTIPFNPQGFMNDMRLYTWAVHDMLSVCYSRIGQIEKAQQHWLEALKHLPEGPDGARILANGKWMVRKDSPTEGGMAKC